MRRCSDDETDKRCDRSPTSFPVDVRIESATAVMEVAGGLDRLTPGPGEDSVCDAESVESSSISVRVSFTDSSGADDVLTIIDMIDRLHGSAEIAACSSSSERMLELRRLEISSSLLGSGIS